MKKSSFILAITVILMALAISSCGFFLKNASAGNDIFKSRDGERVKLSFTSYSSAHLSNAQVVEEKGLKWPIAGITKRSSGIKHLKISKKLFYILSIVFSVVVFLYSLWRILTTRKINKKLTRLIDKLNRAKSEVETEKNKLLTIINNLPDLVYVKDKNSRFLIANQALAKYMSGGSVEDLIGKRDFDFYPENIASKIYRDEQEIMRTGVPIIQKEEHLFNPLGKEMWISTSKVPLYDNKGNIVGLVGIGRDITEKKRVELELRRQKDRIRQYLDIVGVIIVVLDREGRIQLLNKKGCEIIGFDEEEAIGKDWFELCKPEDIRYTVKETFKRVISGEVSGEEDYVNEITNKNGEKRTIAWHNTVIRDENGNITGTLSSGEDITEKMESERRLKETEKKLEMSQRLEAIGRLTSGIAHDFNNLLSVIIGYSDLLKMRAGDNAPYLKEIEEIKKAGERASALISQLLAFSRKQVSKPTRVDLNRLIRNIEKILKRTIGENIELIINLDPNLAKIKTDPAQIEQIIMNLVVNAKHAMPDGGRLTIETRNVYLDENYIVEHPGVVAGNYVMLSVSDTGVGMDEKTKEHIFEPFFTTRKNGLGTGLGLSTVYGIVTQNRGNIWVYSEPGKGTVFKIYLPSLEEKEEGEYKRREGKKGKVKNVPPTEWSGKNVVLVEDEDQVRNMVQEVLESSGFKVSIAKNGEEGLCLINSIGIESIDLIITDVIMPKMGGYDLIKSLKEKNSDKKINVLFISGYSEMDVSEMEFNGEHFTMLQKPFTADQLLEKVGSILKGQAG